MTNISQGVPTHPGQATTPTTQHLHTDPSEGMYGRLATNILAAIEGKRNLLAIGGPFGYQAGRGVETKDNSSTIAFAAAGLTFQSQAAPADNDDTVFNASEAFTPVAGKLVSAQARLKIADVSELGFTFGFVTAGSTEVQSANPADGIFLIKGKAAATVVGRVREASGTARDTGTLITMEDGVEVVVGMKFYFGATEELSWGEWWTQVGTTVTKTVFTALQIEEMFDMIAAAPSLAAHIGVRLNGTAQKSMVLQWAYAEIDR